MGEKQVHSRTAVNLLALNHRAHKKIPRIDMLKVLCLPIHCQGFNLNRREGREVGGRDEGDEKSNFLGLIWIVGQYWLAECT